MRIAKLEATSSERTGAGQPMHDLIKWLGMVAIALLSYFVGHLQGK
jgi:hypothetical protein